MSEEQQVVQEAPVAPAEVIVDQNTEGQAPAETEPNTEDQPERSAEKKANKGHERRINKLLQERAEQKARADYLEKQIEELKPKPVSNTGLKLEDFDFDIDKYAQAVAKAAETEAIKKYHENQQSQTRKQTEERLVSEWDKKANRADDKYDDYNEVVGELKPTNPITIAIMQAENGEDIAYYLGKNLKEAQRIAALDPVSAVREIGRLEAKLLAEPAKVKVPSNAPEPIVPVSGSSNKTAKTIFDADSQEEFERLRRAQIKRR